MGIIITNAKVVNEGTIREMDIRISGERIDKIASTIEATASDQVIDAAGKYLMPGAIDDQVHFREPGLTHKADIYTESRAAVAGGITSYMEMPNTVPNALTQTLLEDKYQIAGRNSAANYSFYMGASNDNLEEVLKTSTSDVCGIKVFMGSSTGNMLVDNEKTLEGIFREAPMLVATHCEDESTIRRNLELYKEKYGSEIPISAHPLIRSEDACFLSSSLAVSLAKKYDTRLHILHISTAKETALFDNSLPLAEKRITAEACIHHLWFDDSFYEDKGTLIKWNPAIKTPTDREQILQAVLDDRIDVIATDHAPHTLEEKNQGYLEAPSGGPLVQHAVVAMLELVDLGKISLVQMVRKMCHAPAELFQVLERGFIREGYYADLVLIQPEAPWTVDRNNILAKCGWSPFEGTTFHSSVSHTFVSGNLVYENGKIIDGVLGKRLLFNRG